MNINQITEKATKDWPVKIICLIIAFFLYLFHQTALIEKKTFVVPLNVIEDGTVMHVGDIQKNISVMVRASREDMENIRYSDLNASINLDTLLEKGTYEVPVKINFSDKMLEFDTLEIRINPEKVKVSVEKKASRYVPVQATVVGSVGYGYQISTIDCNPSVVQIYGPESIINTIDYIYTEKVNVSNAEKNFMSEANFQNFNKLIKILDEEPCKVTVSLEQQKVEKEFTAVPIIPVNLAENLELKQPLPEMILKFSGTVTVIDVLSLSRNTAMVDFRDIEEPGTYELPVRISVPYATTLLEKNLETVTVVVEKKIEEQDEETKVETEA